MYAMNSMFEAFHTMAAFSEMFDIIEYFGEFFYRETYTNHSLKDESKNQTSTNEWTTEWLETQVSTTCNDSDNLETSHALSADFLPCNVAQESILPETQREGYASILERLHEESLIPEIPTIETLIVPEKHTVNRDFSDEFSSKLQLLGNKNEILDEKNDVYIEKSKEKTDIFPEKTDVFSETSTEKSYIYSDKSHEADDLNFEESNKNDVMHLENQNEKDDVYHEKLNLTDNTNSEYNKNCDVYSKNNSVLDHAKQISSDLSTFESNFKGVENCEQNITAIDNNTTNECEEKLSKTIKQAQFVEQSTIDQTYKSLEQTEDDEKLNNFEECTEKVKQILADKRFGEKLQLKSPSNKILNQNESNNKDIHKNITKYESELASNNLDNSKTDCDKNSNLDTNSFINEVNLDLNSGLNSKKLTSEDLKTKKFITSSWDLVSILKLLYHVTEPKAPEVFPEDQLIQRRAYVLSKGAFTNFPEGYYNIIISNMSLSVMKEEENIFLQQTFLHNFSLNHAEVHLENGNTIMLDNRMGRCLYLKCETHEELLSLHDELQQICRKCWQFECINLVHYPLKCHQNIIIIDLGSCSSRAGILMDEPTLPTLFFPSVCSTNKTTGKYLYGMEALQPTARQNSTVSFPLRPSVKIIKHSVDIDQVTGIFKKIFKDLKVDPTNYRVLVCLPRSLSMNVQNALVKVLLEDLNVQAVSLAHQAILTMYAHNVSTGVVVDIGDRMDILPVIDGFIVENGVTRLPYGGQRLIHHMKHALAQKHISLNNDLDSFVVQYITEKLTYIAEDFDKENNLATLHPETVRKSVDLQSFALDVNCLQNAVLDEARFKVPEGLFNPDLWGLDSPGVHKLVQKAIQAACVDARKKVAENIYLSGGVTMIPGFVDRLRKEITKLNEPRFTPKVYASHYRYHCTYIGACRFARMEVFPQVCVTKEEYKKSKESCLKKFMLCV